MKHDCPLVLRSRYGAWAECRCGFVSRTMTTPGGASLEWARHVARAAPAPADDRPGRH